MRPSCGGKWVEHGYAERGYRMLRRRFDSWTKVMNAPVSDVQREIAICGLARMRARRLQDLLRRIKSERGTLNIDHLANEPMDAAFEYLMSFHGIGPKTAAFTLLFAFHRPLVPVDNGVLRVLRRLRLVRPKARDLECERTISPLVANGAHYATHVLLFRHARERCRPKNPKCDDCDLLPLCPHGQRVVRHKPGGSPAAPQAPPSGPVRLRGRLQTRGGRLDGLNIAVAAITLPDFTRMPRVRHGNLK